MRIKWILLAMWIAGSGCVVGRATSSLYDVPRERATECQDICTKLDLQMSAVVIVMNTTGCVCEPRGARAPGVPSPTPQGAVGSVAPRGGAAAIAAAQVVAQT